MVSRVSPLAEMGKAEDALKVKIRVRASLTDIAAKLILIISVPLVYMMAKIEDIDKSSPMSVKLRSLYLAGVLLSGTLIALIFPAVLTVASVYLLTTSAYKG